MTAHHRLNRSKHMPCGHHRHWRREQHSYKEQVPRRSAACQLRARQILRQESCFRGPTLTSVERLPASIRLHFAHIDGGLVAKGEKLQEFTIAGEDHKWYWAGAQIEGDTIDVSSPSVPNPKENRYAWQSNPAANLFNGAGLPAAPFRTDNRPGKTQDARPY
jgi:sialate O-acetylesterase